MQPFVPLVRNPHALTVLTHFWKRRLDVSRFPVERIVHESEPGGRVLILRQRPPGRVRGRIVLLHGLEGSSEAGYMISMASSALEAGFAVDRFNFRSCGHSDSLSETMYHAGLTVDVRSYLRTLEQPAFLAGFSLGGNVALKLAGELGPDGGGLLAGVCAVSTPIDLASSVERLGAPENRVYQYRFVSRMKQRLRARKVTGMDGLRTIFDIDDRFTSRAFGFRDARHYYQTQSSIGFLDRIMVPTLLVQAKDDHDAQKNQHRAPFAAARASPAVRPNENILRESHRPVDGGHEPGIRRVWRPSTPAALRRSRSGANAGRKIPGVRHARWRST
ncbi:MAG: alpha/beta fold hydrolase, partial [Acidobacteria bacterium]|nr:alpha/beta fold hydrolase [Acidobacteriota bacterium]